jgi:acetyltransferase-like isoleucine patch superfamily enzyme
MRALRHFPAKKSNSLEDWFKAKNPVIVVFNFLIISLTKFLPSLALKRFLLRLTGMKVGRHVSVGLGVQFDIFFPELITLEDNCLLGYNATILCHEFLVKELRTGPVVIGENAMIGANSTLLPGVRVGRNASVSAMSLVNRNVKDRELVQGVPIKGVKK